MIIILDKNWLNGELLRGTGSQGKGGWIDALASASSEDQVKHLLGWSWGRETRAMLPQ
jgi:hypothetical protein